MDFQNLSSTDKVMGLYEFLLEAELQHYYEEFKNSLKIMKGTQLKYVTTNDLTQIGMSKPEQRRFKKMYSKYFPNNYFTKIKKLLSSGKKSDSNLPTLTEENLLEAQLYSNHSIKVPSKHIIPVENIAINKELGEGEFGVVQQGIWSNDNQRIQVAIKCLCRERMQTNSMEFLKEAAVMHSIEHPNIVRLYGVVLHSDSLMLVTELAPLRSLLECLKEISLRPNFPVLTLCDFASQICDGMSYLEAKRLIHRDLAARNILVFSKNRVKISDFGLSRALRAGKDYYQTNFNVNLKLPIAWCAPECISYLRFTSASDVWAYAVTLWEMFSYGFQPWAAFSGHQILMAIDEPNFQRLEQPDCCPDTYYGLMNKCWQHDPLARPKFHEIAFMLPECCPQQVQATVNVSHEGKRNDQLDYRLGDIITILQKGGSPNQANWKGILKNCKTGYFNPQTTMPYVKTVQQVQATNLHATSSSSSETGSNRSTSSLLGGTFRNSLLRSDSKRHTFISKRPLQREMISAPQGEMKHTGHIGLDGAYFGDVSFLDPAVSNYNNPVPRQIVTPYKPSEDLEQMPLINPNSPSHLTGSVSTPPYPLLNQDPSRPRTFDEAISLPMPKNGVDEIDSVAACDVFSSKSIRLKKLLGDSTINKTLLSKMKSATLGKSFKTSTAIAQKPSCVNAVDKNKVTDGEVPHEYHEISDTEEALSPSKMLPDSPRYDKEFSKELIAELDNMLSSLNGTDPELIVSKLTTKTEDDATGRSSHSPRASKKKLPSVKPISAYDQKTLDTAIALANELTTRSMNDLDNSYQKAPSSPIEKNKFHSKLVATLSHLGHTSHNASTHKLDGKQERRNFSKEAQSVPDLQSTFTEASKMAYASLIDQPTPSLSLMVDEARHLHQLRFNTHTGTTDNIESNRNERSSCDDNLPIMNSEVNEIPLPPRDRTKLQTISKQKHTRKHPLMAPAQNLQFSVEKIHNNNDQEDNGLVSSSNSPEQYENYSMNIKNTESNSKGNGAIPKKIVKRKLKSENNDDSSEPLYMNFEAGLLIGPREFFNVHSLHYESKIDNPQFENYDDEVDGPLNFNASTNPFSERESGNLISNPFEMGELKNPSSKEYLQFADQVSKASDYTSREKECKFVCRAIEKVEESSLSKDSPDHVSVEDLLEFAGQKPCGRQRGAESDEVRIMLKVLNQETSRAVITPEDCLQVLEYCEWDVYQTLKLVEVCFAPGIHAGIPECARALLAANGDTKQAKTLLTLQ